MNPADLDRYLADTLADRKLSRGERESLADWLTANARTDQQKGVVRHTAFDVARRSAESKDAAQVIGWLEDVLKVVAPVVISSGAAAVSSAASHVCFSPGDSCWQHIVHRLQTARRAADLCVFTITDDRISRAIVDAHRRKVRVRVITDQTKAGDLGSDVQQFREIGIAVKLADVTGPSNSGSSGHMHHKFAIFDGTALLNGSYNWTRGAASTNFENLVDTADPDLIAIFAAEFERLWNQF